MSKPTKKVYKLGEEKYNGDWLRSVSEDVAIKTMRSQGREVDQIRNAWKQANGLSVRTHEADSEKVAKPKRARKATTKK